MAQDFVSTLTIAIFLIAIGFIAYYTSKIRRLENNEKYSGFLIEVLFKGDINNDIAPILINYDPNKLSNPAIELLYKRRNFWVLLFWINLFLLVILLFLLRGWLK